jgi:hypothetical protein
MNAPEALRVIRPTRLPRLFHLRSRKTRRQSHSYGMKILKASLAAVSAVLALHSIYGAILEITGAGRALPMLRLEVWLDRPVQGDLFDHAVCAVLFSIYPLWVIVAANRQRKAEATRL